MEAPSTQSPPPVAIDREAAVLVVADDGPGVSPEIVEEHRGSIHLESPTEGGARFVVDASAHAEP